jgi:Fe-S-cluster-containing dehydrogenase component
VDDDDWVWIASHMGRVKCQVRLMDGVNPHTVWTWNAIGKRKGAWGLDEDAPEVTRGFLLNHLISELLPEGGGGYRYSNSDPITGQAAWFDLRVSIEKADGAGETSRGSRRWAGAVCPRRRQARLWQGRRWNAHDQPARDTPKKLGLVIDLDTCVGCQACVTSCKEWNTGGYSAPLSDHDPYGADPSGAFLNRVHSYEMEIGGRGRTVHFPRSCLHCEEPDCVTVCPTGASYKRAEDGIVLVNPDTCIGCKLCSWACPYGAREYDHDDGVMKKCTLCVDRIYNETCPRKTGNPPAFGPVPPARGPSAIWAIPTAIVSRSVAERGGFDLLEEFGYKPVNKYLPPRAPRWPTCRHADARGEEIGAPRDRLERLFAWIDRRLSD